ncbi:hypothetical protein DSECCO2_547900 [anaerobic digester metagenome]
MKFSSFRVASRRGTQNYLTQITQITRICFYHKCTRIQKVANGANDGVSCQYTIGMLDEQLGYAEYRIALISLFKKQISLLVL